MVTAEMRAAAWAAWMETENVWSAFDAAQKHDPVYLAAREVMEARLAIETQTDVPRYNAAVDALGVALGMEPA